MVVLWRVWFVALDVDGVWHDLCAQQMDRRSSSRVGVFLSLGNAFNSSSRKGAYVAAFFLARDERSSALHRIVLRLSGTDPFGNRGEALLPE